MKTTGPPTLPLEYLRNLEKLAADTESADYTITCSGRHSKVHKHVLSLHSEYFATLFKSQYKESSTNRIDLVDDPLAAVESMMEYFYKFNYDIEHTTTHLPSDQEAFLDNLVAPDGASDGASTPASPLNTTLQRQADIYTLADKYDIPGLKAMAKARFESSAKTVVQFPAEIILFISLIPYVYTHTPPNEQGLRSSIIYAWRKAPETINKALGDERLKALIDRFPELGLDLIKGLLTKADVHILDNHSEASNYTDELFPNREPRRYEPGYPYRSNYDRVYRPQETTRSTGLFSGLTRPGPEDTAQFFGYPTAPQHRGSHRYPSARGVPPLQQPSTSRTTTTAPPLAGNLSSLMEEMNRATAGIFASQQAPSGQSGSGESA